MTRVIIILGPTALMLGLGADLPAILWLALAPVVAGLGRFDAAWPRRAWVRVGEVVPPLALAGLLAVAVWRVDWRASRLPTEQDGLTADTAARLLTSDLAAWAGLALLLVVALLAGARSVKERT